VTARTDTDRILSRANQGRTNELVAQDLGLVDDAGRLTGLGRGTGYADDITPDVLQRVREDAGEAYDALRNLSVARGVPVTFRPDDSYRSAIARIADELTEGASDMAPLGREAQNFLTAAGAAESLTPAQIISTTQRLRASARTNLRSIDDPARHDLGRAQRRVADEIEAFTDRMLQKYGYLFDHPRAARLVEEWQRARTIIAKTHQIEDVLEGTDVNAIALARQAHGGTSDRLREIVVAAERNPTVMRTPARAGDPGGLGLMDLLTGGVVRAAARIGTRATARPVTPYSMRDNLPALYGELSRLQAAYSDATPEERAGIKERIREVAIAIKEATASSDQE
jgi:hypothetical protein